MRLDLPPFPDLLGLRPRSLVSAACLADVQVKLVLLVAAHVRVRHEVQGVAETQHGQHIS